MSKQIKIVVTSVDVHGDDVVDDFWVDAHVADDFNAVKAQVDNVVDDTSVLIDAFVWTNPPKMFGPHDYNFQDVYR